MYGAAGERHSEEQRARLSELADAILADPQFLAASHADRWDIALKAIPWASTAGSAGMRSATARTRWPRTGMTSLRDGLIAQRGQEAVRL